VRGGGGVYDLILKKRGGGELSREEINYLIAGYTAGTIPDYQLSAFAMAVYFQGNDGSRDARFNSGYGWFRRYRIVK